MTRANEKGIVFVCLPGYEDVMEWKSNEWTAAGGGGGGLEDESRTQAYWWMEVRGSKA